MAGEYTKFIEKSVNIELAISNLTVKHNRLHYTLAKDSDGFLVYIIVKMK